MTLHTCTVERNKLAIERNPPMHRRTESRLVLAADWHPARYVHLRRTGYPHYRQLRFNPDLPLGRHGVDFVVSPFGLVMLTVCWKVLCRASVSGPNSLFDAFPPEDRPMIDAVLAAVIPPSGHETSNEIIDARWDVPASVQAKAAEQEDQREAVRKKRLAAVLNNTTWATSDAEVDAMFDLASTLRTAPKGERLS